MGPGRPTQEHDGLKGVVAYLLSADQTQGVGKSLDPSDANRTKNSPRAVFYAAGRLSDKVNMRCPSLGPLNTWSGVQRSDRTQTRLFVLKKVVTRLGPKQEDRLRARQGPTADGAYGSYRHPTRIDSKLIPKLSRGEGKILRPRGFAVDKKDGHWRIARWTHC